MIDNELAPKIGFIFEIGFNIGILTYIKQQKIKHNFSDRYFKDLQQVKFDKILDRIFQYLKIIDVQQRQDMEKWLDLYLFKGFIGGLNFLREYLSSFLGDYPQDNDKKKKNLWGELEIIYYQCNFAANTLGTYSKPDQESYQDLFSQFPTLQKINPTDYIQTGEFLKSDTLIFLRYRKYQYRILVVDLSAFSMYFDNDIKDIENMEVLRRLFIQEVNYLRSKGNFSNLSMDSGNNLHLELSPNLTSYFNALHQDKETLKFIQAGSYAYSFYQWLNSEKINFFNNKDHIIINVIGYSDRGLSSMSVNTQNLDILKICQDIYQGKNTKEDINIAKSKVLDQIKFNAIRCFQDGRKFINQILEVKPDTINKIEHKETITDFMSSVGKVESQILENLGLSPDLDLKNAHAELITQELNSNNQYIFLTGNPGIGKTTAIANFLKKYAQEGFLFFYVSPRKQVNLDIINKLTNDHGNLITDDLICLNTNSILIQQHQGKPTVQYQRNQPITDNFTVNFVPLESEEETGDRQNRLRSITDTEITDQGNNSKGVIRSICEAIYTLIKHQKTHQILATVSVQGLKKVYFAKDTLEHFGIIFKDVYNKTDKEVNFSKMRRVFGKIKHLFIMIDEITGDDSGADFLNRIHEIAQDYELFNPESGFNTKIIVADASIVEQEVIKQHLENKEPEPDKIYFRKLSQDDQKPAYLSREYFKFRRQNAVIINTNSYPASTLDIHYRVFIDSKKFDLNHEFQPDNNLLKSLQSRIFNELQTIRNQIKDDTQILIYIQDKKRLGDLIGFIQKQEGEHNFVKNEHYLEIHADISENEKKEINKYQDQVKVIFMTASGSRGLSFPKVKHILVEVPRFSVEKNLMEIIQVIYRGRGDKILDNEHKNLYFYLGDEAIYYQKDGEDKTTSLQKSCLGLLDLLILLKGAINTRIFGSAKIGRNQFLIIPIGGKATYMVGDTFTETIVNLIRKLKSEHNPNQSHKHLKLVYESLERLLGNADFTFKPKQSGKNQKTSYINLQENFNFTDYRNNLIKFFDFPLMEDAHIMGNFIILPTDDKLLDEKYQFTPKDLDKYATSEVLNAMVSISKSDQYPDSLRNLVKDGIELIGKLRENLEKTQEFKQKISSLPQYCMIPLFAFIAGDTMQKYFEDKQELLGFSQQEINAEVQIFRDILSAYIRTVYPVQNILPIGCNYEKYPFILFRSYNLESMRSRIFTDKYLLNSTEFNVLNMILSQ
jgi:Helicase conserved C-terminal domain